MKEVRKIEQHWDNAIMIFKTDDKVDTENIRRYVRTVCPD